MEGKGYTVEANHVRVVCCWRQACDTRGLSDAQRSLYNKRFLDYMLDELMPWHKDPQFNDYSLLEVNQ